MSQMNQIDQAEQATSLAAYYRFDLDRPDEVGDGGTEHWYGPATNFVVETIRGAAGSVTELVDEPDEAMVVLAPGSARVRISAGGQEVLAEPGSVVVVPPGSSRTELLSEGFVHRVHSRLSPLHEATRHLDRQDASSSVRPLQPAPAPPTGYRLRHYRLTDFDVPRPKWTFRSTNLMVAVIGPMTEPRGTRLTPHLHEDFEQATLVVDGEYVHHVRRAWGADSSQWRDDEHVTVGAPSVTVISPPDLHTSQTVGTGPFLHVDVFSPPRADFIAAGQVLNTHDYPSPPGDEAR